METNEMKPKHEQEQEVEQEGSGVLRSGGREPTVQGRVFVVLKADGG